MAPFSPIPRRHPIRVILSSTALLRFMSARSAAALAVAQLGIAAFFIAGVTRSTLGDSAGWFVLVVTGCAAIVRAIDLESWALLVPGGFVGRVTTAFGPRFTGVAAASTFVERLLLGALTTVVIGHYVGGVAGTAIAGWRFTRHIRPEDLATVIAIGALGLLWLPTRIGRSLSRETLARGLWIGVAILLATMVWGVVTVARGHGSPLSVLLSLPPTMNDTT